MNSANHRISLDIHSVHAQAVVAVRRWDTARSVFITLTEHGSPYTIAQDCSAEFVCRKPDGSILKNPCVLEDDVIRYDLTLRTTSVSGSLDCEIRLMNGAGDLITSPRFTLLVYATIYDYGDAVESEIASANTVKSANPGYAEVFMWSDGNPDGEERVGYFVGSDEAANAGMVRICQGTSDVRGVTMKAPGFASNAPGERFDQNSDLLSAYCYVGLLGFAPVIDNGRCQVNGRCMPGDDGTAVPDASGGGFLVAERLDEARVLILLEQEADTVLKLNRILDQRLQGIRTVSTAVIGTQWAGDAPPYTQTLGIPGLLDTDTPHVAPVLDGQRETALAQQEAWRLVSKAAAAEGTLTFTCLEEKPDREIPIQVEVIR